MSAARRPCFTFRDTGKCKYGKKRKFSHGSDDERPPPAPDPISAWRRQIKSQSSARFATSSGANFDHNKFFQDALGFVQGSSDLMQDVVVLLGKEDGLQRIREMIDKLCLASEGYLQDMYNHGLQSIFRIVCLPRVAQSNILEQSVVAIYNCVYGPNGTRAVKLFTILVEKLMFVDHMLEDDDFEVLLNFFAQMTIVNGSSNVNDSLSRLADLMIDRALVIAADIRGSQHLSIRRHAQQLNRFFSLGKAIPTTDFMRATSQTSKATFKHVRKPPGGRHDNDDADIRKIKILPTYQEVSSETTEYLPVRGDTSSHNLSRIQALFDRHFRLLREDTVGQLRDAVRGTLKSTDKEDAKRSAGQRTYVYRNMTILDAFASTRSGLEFFVRVDSPVKRVSNEKAWWGRSKRLQVDALVCITGLQDNIIYCTVSAQGPPSIPRRREKIDEDTGHAVEDEQFTRLQNVSGHGLYGRKDGSYLTLKPVSTSSEDMIPLLNALIHTDKSANAKLVEFPGVLLPTFAPSLSALQDMYTREDIPFADILTAGPSEEPVTIAPAYARSAGFTYDSACLTDTPGTALNFSPGLDFDTEKLTSRTTLDTAQAQALLHFLSSSLALVQGPPGTGKSFTGIAILKTLLKIKEPADLGPIVCVCCTNHALDQLLEHLHASGIKQIVRVGSRSKSRVLDEVNLNIVSKTVQETKTEGQIRRTTHYLLNKEAESMADSVYEVSKAGTLSHLKDYLRVHYPAHYKELFHIDVDDDGFTVYVRPGSNPLTSWLKGGARAAHRTRRLLTVLQQTRLEALTNSERRSLHEYWLTEIQNKIANDILDTYESFNNLHKQEKRIRDDRNLRCLEAAYVIGITTSGLARQLDVFRKLRTKVLLCEEAGEVLEANLLPALLPSLEHVILIGDHLQLRPQVQNYELSRESFRGSQYALDLSLFERLVNDPYETTPCIAFQTLEVQRRMHPSISQLIKKTLYPNLLDFENVAQYPGVSGMRKRLFWLDHPNLEDKSDPTNVGSTSHSNVFEVGLVTSLVTHLIRQGIYMPQDIAILTPYLSQLFKIRQSLSTIMEVAIDERDLDQAARQGVSLDQNEAHVAQQPSVAKTTLLQAVRVATVDNFQGEEAKVVIVSLVRANEENRCGFLRTPNRINVLLSRAQHGMYIIGNKYTAGSVPMWSEIVKLLEERDNIGTELELQCSRHPNTILAVSDPEHFSVASHEGGCDLMCGRRLFCGHACRQKCHADTLHGAVRCLESCPRSLPGCDHSCPNYCGDPCVKRCSVILQDDETRLPCQHVVQNPFCWQKQGPEKVTCLEIVQKEISKCGHILRLSCSTDVSSSTFKCTSKCETSLPCGHSCSRKCADCRTDKLGRRLEDAEHGKCKATCGRKYDSCGHSCRANRHAGEPCPPCTSQCEIRCPHSQCTKKCSEPCAPCASSTCASACPHGRCTMPCAAPCNWLPCSKRCTKILGCGHQCPSLCGEQCPSEVFCQACADPAIKAQQVDMIMFQTYEEIDLDEEPCIVLLCGHIMTVSSMNGVIGMKDYYEISHDGRVIRPLQKDFDLSLKVPACPSCRGSLRFVSRYGRIVRQVLLAESTKRFIHWSNSQYVPLATKAQSAQEVLAQPSPKVTSDFARLGQIPIHLDGTALSHIDAISATSKTLRYRPMLDIYERIKSYADRVKIEEQPFRRVWELVQHSRRIGRELNETDFEVDTDALQTRQHLLARSLLIRCHLAVVCDFLSKVSIDPNSIKVNLIDHWEECKLLARSAKGSSQPAIEVEAYLFYARYCAIAQFCYTTVSTRLGQTISITQQELGEIESEISKLKTQGLARIRLAEGICRNNEGSTIHLQKEKGEVETMVTSSSISDVLRPEEMKQIYEAMAAEFGGTGHWYYCENRHPFTIGECGMAMQLARCPQCGAHIGGQNHESVAGVTHADDLERQMRNLRIQR